jgi:Flp pilus assembly protein TadD
MELTIEQALLQGVTAHKEGKLEEAERLYRAILKSQPAHPDANHNLGVLAVSVNKSDVALPLFKIALEANPKIEQFWLSYIDALIKEKQFDNANDIIEQAKKQGVAEEKLNAFESQLSSKSQNVNSANPSQEQLNSLLGHYQNGRFNDAEKLAMSITQKFPTHQLGWKVLGAVLKQTGRVIDSLTAMQKSVQLAPQDAAAHSNLGITLKELGRLDEAEASYMQAIVLKPDFAEAHSNLGITLQELGRLDEAEASYTQAIALKPDYAEAHNNLGATLHELGRLDEAETIYTQAIALKPDYAEAMLNLSITQSYMNDLEAEIVSLQNVLRIDSDDYGLRAGVSLAICNFLEGDFAESKKHLLAATKIQEKKSSESKAERVYWRYLSNILKWRENKYLANKKEKNDKNLYVLGESHSLTSHHLRIQRSGFDFFCSAKLIRGCKQWHLGNAFRNQYKHQFETIFFALPKHSYVLVAIGEIDCRLDTGIIAHKRKFPEKQIKEIISNTIENYLNYIVNNNSDYQHNVTIQGVPCPNLDVRNHSEKDIRHLGEVIKIFNYELKMQSKEKGFGFLDTHQLTNKGDGMSNGSWHIDDYHLSPGGMQEAWRRCGSEKSYEQFEKKATAKKH